MERIDDSVQYSGTTMSERLVALLDAEPLSGSAKLQFSGVSGRDVYNITAPFEWMGQLVLAGRVEHRETELSDIMIFAESSGIWRPLFKFSEMEGMQDPCMTRIGGRIVLGGVRFPYKFYDGTRGWKMEFYAENASEGIDFLFSGPPNMKDIRLLGLEDGRVLVLTRPQGVKGGRGRIGYYVAESLEAIDPVDIYAAPLIEGLCKEDEWVGANEVHLLGDGLVGVLGHVASFGEAGARHYRAMAFCLNISTGEVSAPRIIARRGDFPAGPAKRDDLDDVLFAGGLVRLGNGDALLYVGLSDAESGYIRISDPFLPFTAAAERGELGSAIA